MVVLLLVVRRLEARRPAIHQVVAGLVIPPVAVAIRPVAAGLVTRPAVVAPATHQVVAVIRRVMARPRGLLVTARPVVVTRRAAACRAHHRPQKSRTL